MLSRTFTKSFGSIATTLPRQSIVTLARFQSTTTTAHHPTPNTITENGELKIKVAPIPRPNEEPETKRRRLVYQSRKRGILESDLLLSKFADKYLSSMSYEDMVEYDTLLDEPDWDIYYWATKNYDVTPLPDKWKNSKILKMLQEMSENKDREVLRMPNLKAQNDQ